MFAAIEDHILLAREERRAHLDLSAPCIEIGGCSKDFRGLLAHHLKTTMPKSRVALLCHACNNDKCSNVLHLYWGTYSDNRADLVATGWKRPPRTLSEEHKRNLGISMRRAMKGKPKSVEHRHNISIAVTRTWSIGRATECHSVDAGSIPAVRTNMG